MPKLEVKLKGECKMGNVKKKEMNKEEKKIAKQMKKENKKKVAQEDSLRLKKNRIVSKLDKIDNSIDDVIEYIDKNKIDIETEQKNKINSISNDLEQVKESLKKVEENVEGANNISKKGFNIFGITLPQIFAYFVIYSIFGYLGETLFAFLTGGVIESRQSFLYGPFCAIYGLGAVVLIVGLQKFKKRNLTLIIGGIILGALTEYLVSLIGEMVFGVKWWDYSNLPFNINGRICAAYSLMWGLIALVFVRFVNPKVDRFISLFPMRTLKTITSIIMIFLLCDWLISSVALEIFYVRMEDTHHIELRNSEQSNQLGRLLYKNPVIRDVANTIWSDKVMIKTFPNLRVTTKNGAVIYVNKLYKDIKPYYIKVFEPVLFDLREQEMTQK